MSAYAPMIHQTTAPVNVPPADAWMRAFKAVDDIFVAECAALRKKYPRRHRKGDPHRDAYLTELADIQARYETNIDNIDDAIRAGQEVAL